MYPGLYRQAARVTRPLFQPAPAIMKSLAKPTNCYVLAEISVLSDANIVSSSVIYVKLLSVVVE